MTENEEIGKNDVLMEMDELLAAACAEIEKVANHAAKHDSQKYFKGIKRSAQKAISLLNRYEGLEDQMRKQEREKLLARQRAVEKRLAELS